MGETWGFAKMIFPLLLVGVFLSGVIRVLMPQDLVATYVGSNTLFAVMIPVIFGIFVYFPTLVEVPMAKTFLDLGMSRGALLAYLLADPVVSLPSILVVRRIMGTKRTAAYVGLIFVLTVSAGLLFGHFFG
ncbi:putative permease [Candidatus Burarchaeum australiense]|nr:putative permease [Candidatus Burarchaeum australiense]